jgi:tetratricopeptide (TPR) repeat protein
VLARLAGAHRDEADPARRVATGGLAVESARRSGDPEALSYALRGLCAAQHAIGDHDQRLAVAEELRAVARTVGDKEGECEALSAEMLVHAERNAFDTVRLRVDALTALADELRQPSQRWFPAAANAMLALHAGRLRDAEQLVPAALELGGRAEAVLAAAAYATQLYLLRREQGSADDALQPLARVAADSPARPFFRCALASLHTDLGRHAEARRIFEELAPNGFEIVPRDNEWLLAAAFLVDTCRALDDVTRGALLYDELLPLAERSTANVPEGDAGAMARYLGILAAMLGRDDLAVGHYRAAIEIDAATSGLPWAAYARADLAEALARQGENGTATELRDQAAATASELGLGRLSARLAAMGV